MRLRSIHAEKSLCCCITSGSSDPAVARLQLEIQGSLYSYLLSNHYLLYAYLRYKLYTNSLLSHNIFVSDLLEILATGHREHFKSGLNDSRNLKPWSFFQGVS